MKTFDETMDRAKFLQTCSKAALFAAIGITAASCSSDSGPTSVNTDDEVNDDQNQDDSNDSGDNSSGINIDGNTITIDLNSDEASDLNQSEGWINITESGANVIVINAAGVFRAFDNRCTHSNCRTSWEFSNQELVCTCHNSVFSNTGERLAGPATSDLAEFNVERENDILTITKS